MIIEDKKHYITFKNEKLQKCRKTPTTQNPKTLEET
jgi:hypothetical protein